MQKIIEKWYKLLGFEEEYGKISEELLNALNNRNITEFDEIAKVKNPILNLAWFLYKCEEVAAEYEKKGITEDILSDTLADIKRWADIYKNYSGGKTGLEEIDWIIRHMRCELFKLGRLQFAFGEAECTDEEYGINKGESIIEVHIPSGGKLSLEECEKSFEKAEQFFKKYFPEYEYRFYTCHSWLLDDNLRKILREDSNILKFRELFSVIREDASNAALKYIFRWNIKEEEISDYDCVNSMQKSMKEYFTSGGKLYESYGIIKRKKQ